MLVFSRLKMYSSLTLSHCHEHRRASYGTQLRLRDVPALNYFSTDQPFPRGEILVKNEHVALGYFGDADRTKEAFLEDGWYATGMCVYD